jgi:hypothetical protein
MATAHGSGIIYCSSRLMGQKQREFPTLRVVESKAKAKVVLERSSNYEFSSTQKVTDRWVVLARQMGPGCHPCSTRMKGSENLFLLKG